VRRFDEWVVDGRAGAIGSGVLDLDVAPRFPHRIGVVDHRRIVRAGRGGMENGARTGLVTVDVVSCGRLPAVRIDESSDDGSSKAAA